MESYILNAIIWTLAFYGLFEIIKTIIYFYTYPKISKEEGTYVIIAVKNAEEYIEGFLRSIIFRILYGKEEYIKQILIVDLGSEDSTRNIIKKMELDYECIKIIDKEKLDKIICSDTTNN